MRLICHSPSCEIWEIGISEKLEQTNKSYLHVWKDILIYIYIYITVNWPFNVGLLRSLCTFGITLTIVSLLFPTLPCYRFHKYRREDPPLITHNQPPTQTTSFSTLSRWVSSSNNRPILPPSLLLHARLSHFLPIFPPKASFSEQHLIWHPVFSLHSSSPPTSPVSLSLIRLSLLQWGSHLLLPCPPSTLSLPHIHLAPLFPTPLSLLHLCLLSIYLQHLQLLLTLIPLCPFLLIQGPNLFPLSLALWTLRQCLFTPCRDTLTPLYLLPLPLLSLHLSLPLLPSH